MRTSEEVQSDVPIARVSDWWRRASIARNLGRCTRHNLAELTEFLDVEAHKAANLLL